MAVERFSARDRSPGGIASQLTPLGDQYKKPGVKQETIERGARKVADPLGEDQVRKGVKVFW